MPRTSKLAEVRSKETVQLMKPDPVGAEMVEAATSEPTCAPLASKTFKEKVEVLGSYPSAKFALRNFVSSRESSFQLGEEAAVKTWNRVLLTAKRVESCPVVGTVKTTAAWVASCRNAVTTNTVIRSSFFT